MKIIASIFLLLVGFMIIQPAIGSTQKTYVCKTESSSDVCCAKKHSCEKPAKDDNENACTKCNPFMPCAYGNFFVNELPFEHSAVLLILSTKMILTNDKIISSYIADCWHPPKQVSS
jgi:hypothetical protein